MKDEVFLLPKAPIFSVHKVGKLDKQNKNVKPNENFAQIFQQKISQEQELKISAHAEKRLLQRDITLDQAKIQKLEKAVDKAQAKGARESLILMNNLAFLVNIPNKTVITAMDQDSMKENVFTNIDSAIIL